MGTYSKWALIQSCLFLFFCALFSLLVIKDYSGPLVGGGDTEYWEYTGFYLEKNLNWFPFPQLNLINNQSFYPTGINQVFQPWAFERDLFYTFFHSILGSGPWLQIYYGFSILICSLGTSLLLLREYGPVRSFFAGFLATFFNFYGIRKYPEHLGYSILHWTTLSLVTDFLLVKKVILRQPISVRFLILKVCLLVLCLSQELGYIAGFGLMSFTISILFIGFILVLRSIENFSLTRNNFASINRAWRAEIQVKANQVLLLLFVFVICTWLYVPLALQINFWAKQFDFTEVRNVALWLSPFRILLPLIPGVNPILGTKSSFFLDRPEDAYDTGPGLSVIILAILGLWQARSKITIFIPLLILLFLLLFYSPIAKFTLDLNTIIKWSLLIFFITSLILCLQKDRQRQTLLLILAAFLLTYFLIYQFFPQYLPDLLPTLKIFPWFAFNRIANRSLVIYPVILTLFAIHIQFDSLNRKLLSIFFVILICFSCLELQTIYALKQNYQPAQWTPEDAAYMEYVKRQPGEAVLDWPFCAVGGNGVGVQEGLCPYYKYNSSIFSYRRFHTKKVMGQYFGRLHPSQLSAYLQTGWDHLFAPNGRNIFQASYQTRCFTLKEWRFFTTFYQQHDFAGINLYIDRLPESCPEEFYQRFGQPAIETNLGIAGKVQFLPKRSAKTVL